MALNLSFMSGIAGGIAHTGVLIGETTLICVFAALFAYFYIYRRKFTTTCIIVSDRVNEQRKIFFDKGAFLKKRGNYESFRLQKDKINIMPPAFKYLYPSSKGNTIFFHQKGPREYYPVMLGEVMDLLNEGKVLNFKGEEQDVVNWNCVESLRDMQTYGKQSFFEKYGSYILFAVAATFILVMIYIVLQKFEVLSGVSENLKEAAQALGSLKQSGTLVPAAP
jgi:hypothetical protein